MTARKGHKQEAWSRQPSKGGNRETGGVQQGRLLLAPLADATEGWGCQLMLPLLSMLQQKAVKHCLSS